MTKRNRQKELKVKSKRLKYTPTPCSSPNRSLDEIRKDLSTIVSDIDLLIERYNEKVQLLKDRMEKGLVEPSSVVGIRDGDVNVHNARQTVSCLTMLFARLFFSGDGAQSVANDVFAAAAEQAAPGSINLDGWLHDLMLGIINLLTLVQAKSSLIVARSLPTDHANMLGLFDSVSREFINHLDTLFKKITAFRATVSGLGLDVRVYKPNASGDHSFHSTVCFLGNSYASHGIDEDNNPLIQDNLNAIFSSLQAALNRLGKIHPELSTASVDKGYQTMSDFLRYATRAVVLFTMKLEKSTMPNRIKEGSFKDNTPTRKTSIFVSPERWLPDPCPMTIVTEKNCRKNLFMRRPEPETKVTSRNSPVVSRQFNGLFGRDHVNGGDVRGKRRETSPYSLNVPCPLRDTGGNGEHNDINDDRNTSDSPISVLGGVSLFEAQLTSEMNNRERHSNYTLAKHF